MRRFQIHFFVYLTIGFLFGCDTDSNINDPNETHFIKYYGGDGNQSGVDMVALEDGSTLLLGNSQFAGEKNIYLVKINQNGEMLWEKTFDGNPEVAVDLEPMSNGNFVILATVEVTAEDHDVKLIIISPEGDELASVVYGSPNQKRDTPKSVTQLRDGGFIVTGVTVADLTPQPDVNPDLYSNIFHFRCDAALNFDNVNWDEYYGSLPHLDGAVKVFQHPIKDFYVFGYSDQRIEPEQEEFGKTTMVYYPIADGGISANKPTVLGINSKRDLQSEIRTDFVHKVKEELNSGYLIVATRINPDGQTSLHAARLRGDLVFNPLKDKEFDTEILFGSSSVSAHSATTSLVAPRGFLLLGEEVRSLGAKNLSLTKIDQTGEIAWSVSLGSEEEEDEAAAVSETADGKILVLGTVELGDNQTKMALFKLNSTGRLHD